MRRVKFQDKKFEKKQIKVNFKKQFLSMAVDGAKYVEMRRKMNDNKMLLIILKYSILV